MADAPSAPVTTNGASPVVQDPQVEEGIKLFAGNLAYSIKEEELRSFFAPVASDILTVQIVYRGTRSSGYGFVAVSTEEAATKAVEELNGNELEGRKVIVERAKPAEEKQKEKREKKAKRRVGRRGSKAVPGEVTEAEANGEAEKPQATSEGEGEVAKPKKKKKSVRKTKRKVKDAVTPSPNGTPAEAATEGGDVAAEATSGGEGEKKKTSKSKRVPKLRRPAGETPPGEQSKTTLFVANLPFSIDDTGLAAIFTEVNLRVNSARIVRRRWGHPRRSKGYGFVDVGDEDEQKKAIELLQGKELEGGRAIAIKIAVNSPEEDDEAVPQDEKAPEAPKEESVAA